MSTVTIKQKADTIRSHVNSVNTLIKELAQQGVAVELSTHKYATLSVGDAVFSVDALDVCITKKEVF